MGLLPGQRLGGQGDVDQAPGVVKGWELQAEHLSCELRHQSRRKPGKFGE